MDELLKLKEYMCTQQKSLAVAESITCGNLQALLARVSGASDFFKGGITAYNLGQKVKHLGVEEIHAKKKDCVSEQVAAEMAKGVCSLFNSSIGVATTGYAELSQGIPHAFIAIYDATRAKVVALHKIEENFERVEMQRHVAALALESLYDYFGIEVGTKARLQFLAGASRPLSDN